MNPIQLLQLGKPQEALALLYQALSANPADPSIWVNICLAHEDLKDFEKAEFGYRHVLSKWPANVEAASNLANLCVRSGRLDEAEKLQRQLLDRNPQDGYARNALAHTLVEQLRIDEAIEFFRGSYEYLGYSLNLGIDHEAHRKWQQENDCHSRKIHRPQHDGPIRVGFTGNVFREHACAFCLEPVLEHLDRSRFEVFIYTDNNRDETSERMERLARWRDTGSLSAADWAAQVRDDQIDVLVDLMGHKQGSRVAAICRYELPHVVNYIGYPGPTCGMNIDNCGWAYRPADDAPEIAPAPSDRNGFVTFGSFNRAAKITCQAQRLWGRLLREIPTARLLMTVMGGERNTRARGELEANGVPGARLELIDHPPTRLEYLALANRIDVHLDPWPYNGGATTFDMLWMGVPVVSRRSVYGIGERIQKSVGLGVLAAASDDAYIELARRAARGGRVDVRGRIQRLGPIVARNFEAKLIEVATSRPSPGEGGGPGGCCGE